MNELINKSLIQVVRKTKGGKTKTCQVHDLLRDLSVSKAKEKNLLIEIMNENLDYEVIPKSSRRCVVYSKSSFDSCNDVVVSSQQVTQNFLTLIFYEDDIDACTILGKQQMEFMCKLCKFLRVLDLRYLEIGYLPKAIGNLIHLRELRLKFSNVEGEVPMFLDKL